MIPSNHRQAERALVALVCRGDLEVDDAGRVWRVAVQGRAVGRRRAEKTLPGGYLMVRGTVDGRRVSALAHRLVWQVARGDIADGLVVNHKNGRKADNRLANLEPVTYSENLRHAHALGLIDQSGIRNPAAKLADEQVREIRVRRAAGDRLADIARDFGVSMQYVSRLARGEGRRSVRGAPIGLADGRAALRQPRGPDGRFVGQLAAVTA